MEIESRTAKQVRGAVLDLVCHACPKKLLVLVPMHMSEAEICACQCRAIFARLGIAANAVRVVVLTGTGEHPDEKTDRQIVQDALSNWPDLEASTKVERKLDAGVKPVHRLSGLHADRCSTAGEGKGRHADAGESSWSKS